MPNKPEKPDTSRKLGEIKSARVRADTVNASADTESKQPQNESTGWFISSDELTYATIGFALGFGTAIVIVCR